MEIRLHPKAEQDLSEALNYYFQIDNNLEKKFARPHSPEWGWISISQYQSQIKNQGKRDLQKIRYNH